LDVFNASARHLLNDLGRRISLTWVRLERQASSIKGSQYWCSTSMLSFYMTVCRPTTARIEDRTCFSYYFYLSHCYSIAWDKITPVISVCLFVCLSALSRSKFLTDFDEIWHRHLEPDAKEPFRWGSICNKGIPYFYPIFP